MALEFEFERDAANAQIRRPLLRGRQSVAGLWFPADWLDEAERARRILRNWQIGAQAFRFAEGDLLRYARPLELDCDALDGWALRVQGRALCSAPLTPEEVAALPSADLWLVLGGEVSALALTAATPLDPACWLDVSAYRRVAAYDCSPVLPAMERALSAPGSVREALDGKVPAASSEREAFLREMADGQDGADASKPAPGSVGKSPDGRAAPRHRKAGVLDRLASALEKWLGKQIEGSGSSGGASSTSANGTGASSGRGGSDAGVIPERRSSPPPVQRWREWLMRVAMLSQFSRVFGQRQAAYMRRMLEMFEDGRLDEALRHAIPLGGDGDPSLGPSLGVPQARQELALTAGKGAGASIPVDERLSDYLRQLYRKAFERLDRAGRFDEAVFVLAELLNSREEALDYLERHDRLKQAAALALAWDSKPGTIVRLYCLAGDWPRAVAVARRDRAFAEAVALLERKWPEVAARLREEWADYLVARGDWLEAVEAIWPVTACQERAREWLLAAEAAGGSLGARALVKRAVLLPDTLDACSEQIDALRRDPERYRERAAIAQAVLDLPEKRSKAATVVRPLLRALLADQARGVGQLDHKQWRKLVTLSGDRLLQQDLPGSGFVVEPSAWLYRYQDKRFEAFSACSSLPIADAVPLPDERYLLACGEAGVAVARRDGGIEARFVVPAERLVLADSGQVALALIKRASVWRVSRIDLAKRDVVDLGMIELSRFMSTFDGVAWTVALRDKVQVLDVSRSLQTVLWQVSDLPGLVHELSRGQGSESFLLLSEQQYQVELWRYDMPGRRLKARQDIEMKVADRVGAHPRMVGKGWCVLLSLHRDDEGGIASVRDNAAASGVYGLVLPKCVHEDSRIGLEDRWAAVPISTEAGGIEVLLFDYHNNQTCARIAWPGTQPVGLRCVGDQWLLFDRQGRLFHLNTETSKGYDIHLH